MNLKGLQFLADKGFPIFEDFLIFKNISEISKNFLEKYGEESRWIIVGSDERNDITLNPYLIKKFRSVHFSKSFLQIEFEKIHDQMENEGIPLENRIFSIGRSFAKEETFLSGILFRDDDFVLIDLFEGLRPSGRDWDPHFSLKIPIINGRILLGQFNDFKYLDLLVKLLEDLRKIPFDKKPYLDFVVMNDGRHFYHDLYFVKLKNS